MSPCTAPCCSLTQALAPYLSHPQTKLSEKEVTELRQFLDEAMISKKRQVS